MKAAIIGDPKRSAKYAPDWPIVKETDKVFFDLDAPVEEIVEKAGDADVLLADAIAKVPGELIKRLPGLKLIHSEGVAYNGIDTETAKKCGVPVCNCKGMNAGAVAEQAILLMLGLLRDVVGGNEAEKAGRQLAVKQAMMVSGITDLADCKVGLVGFGDIAVATACMPLAARSITGTTGEGRRKLKAATTSSFCHWMSYWQNATSSASMWP